MKVITWNVNGIRARQAQVQELLATEHPDIVCLQEIKAAPDQVPSLLVSPDEYWSYWHGARGYSGVAVLIRRTVAPEPPVFSHPPFDFEERIVLARVGRMRVASVYVPNGGRDYEAKLRFLEALNRWVHETDEPVGSLLVSGDLNVALEERDVHPKERKPNQIGTRPAERQLLQGLIGAGLTDVGRAMDPASDELFTWWAPWRNLRQRNIGWRIDYILAGALVAPRAVSAVSRREFGTSDHAPVVATFEPGPAV
ncbi:MAG TPA: exodeoxyribonuclease III [Vicinamibacterales bacterium]|nr:exodeoxyribonuclease III [Vicinamibacterales bacterium]